VVKLLLGVPGIDVNKENHDGLSPLGAAAFKGKVKVVALLKAAGAQENFTLTSAARVGSVDVVARHLRAPGVNVNATDRSGETPLYTASKNGHAEVVKLLLGVPGIDVNVAEYEFRGCRYEGTPLYSACRDGHLAVVKLLLGVPGIDVNRADHNGWTPLYAATYFDYTEVMELLLAAPGIDVNRADKEGQTPLAVARDDTMRALLRAAGAR